MKGYHSVEGDRRAQIDKGQKDANQARETNGVGGNLQTRVDVGDPPRKGEAAVARKGPSLPGCGHVEGDVAHNKEKQDDRSERVNAGDGNGIAEHIEKGEGGWIVQCVIDGRDAKYISYEENQAHETIEQEATHYGAWHHKASIFDLFRHVGCTVGA